MIAQKVKDCEIFDEFSGKERREYFSFSDHKVLHHIDTYYYAVCLNEPDNVVDLQRENRLPENLSKLIEKLREMKSYVRGDVKQKLEEIAGMESAAKVFSFYEFCVSLDECFDIFVASSIPNVDTPRVLIQLRSRYLVLEGVWEAIKKSYKYLCDFLQVFELFPGKIKINRVDYAFHTNFIDNPEKYFSHYKLRKHCKTTLSKYGHYGNTQNWSIDTFNLGSRKSNNVYFRAYNKVREVIEVNYKAFFFDRWYENGLISAFDKYVFEKAYELKSYRTGLLVGRLKWYLEFGKDDNKKARYEELLKSCFVKSDNSPFIEKEIKGVIPEPQLICNIEFQTKRAFYKSCANWMDLLPDELFVYDEVNLSSLYSDESEKVDPIFEEVYFFLRNCKAVIDYLTSFGNAVSFVKDASMTKKQFLKFGEDQYLTWWKSVRHCRIDYSGEHFNTELSRNYDNEMSIRRRARMIKGQIAGLSILKEQDVKPLSFVEDVVNVLSTLNDNDIPPIAILADENGEIFEPDDYSDIRLRQGRRMRGLHSKKKKPIPENEFYTEVTLGEGERNEKISRNRN